ncbi:MAG: O-antigen ligase family protein [Terriglobia bacterium]
MQRAVEIILALTVIATTFAFGGVQPFSYSLMEIVIYALVVALLIEHARRGRIQLHVPLWTLLFVLLVVIQLIPLPQGWVSALDPARVLPAGLSSLQHRLGHALTLSIYPHATLQHLLKFLAYLGAFALAAYVFDSRQKKSLLVRVLIVLGLFEAAYGIVQYLADWQRIFTYKKVFYLGMATGTFINHNHFAGFLELTFPFMLATAFYYFQIWQDGHRRGPARVDPATASAAGIQSLIYAFLLVVCVVAVIFSRSRGGILSSFFAIIVIGFLSQVKTRRKAWFLGLASFVLIAVIYGIWIGLNPVLARFEALRGAGAQSIESEGRLPTWKATLEIIRHHPLTGTGLGTFRYAFPHVQTYMFTYHFTHAHNDYLEFLSETGWPGVLLLFVPILVLLGLMIHSFVTDARRYRPAVTLGCIGGVVALLCHSVTDFNLHIPANALVFAVVLGIGYKTTWVEHRAERKKIRASDHPAVSGRVARRSRAF